MSFLCFGDSLGSPAFFIGLIRSSIEARLFALSAELPQLFGSTFCWLSWWFGASRLPRSSDFSSWFFCWGFFVISFILAVLVTGAFTWSGLAGLWRWATAGAGGWPSLGWLKGAGAEWLLGAPGWPGTDWVGFFGGSWGLFEPACGAGFWGAATWGFDGWAIGFGSAGFGWAGGATWLLLGLLGCLGFYFLEFWGVTCLGWAVDGFGFFSPAGAGFFWFGFAFGATSLGASFLGAGLLSDGLRGGGLVPALGCPSAVLAPVWLLPLLSLVNCPGKNPSNQANNSSTLLSCYFEFRFCHLAPKNSP